MRERKILEIIIEVEGESIPGEDIAQELESYTTFLCPEAYRVEAFVGREEGLE